MATKVIKKEEELAPDWLQTNSHATAIWMLFGEGVSGWGGFPLCLIALLLTDSTVREYHVGNEQGETKTTRTFEYRELKRKEEEEEQKKIESSYRLLI